MSASSALIAVFDVGKTNAKLALIDPVLGQEIWSVRRANAIVQGPMCRELDVVAIEAWLLESLRNAPQRERIAVIVPIAHGAAGVLVDHAGQRIGRQRAQPLAPPRGVEPRIGRPRLCAPARGDP